MKARSITAVIALALAGVLSGTQAWAETAPPPDNTAPGAWQCPCPMGHGMHYGMGQGPGHAMRPHACQRLGQIANMHVEQTPSGAVLRLDAKDPTQVDEVRKLAQSFASCMGGMPPTGQ